MIDRVFDLNIVGIIQFGNKRLNVYNSMEEPLFKARDVADMRGRIYSEKEMLMLNLCEEDEKVILPVKNNDGVKKCVFVTEMGLYNILSQSGTDLARAWRRIVHDELINLRKSCGKNIAEQFEDWDHKLDSIYFDEETGMLMQSITVQGGDVISVPFEK